MKKLVIILSSFLFLLLLCILVTFKTIYIYDSSSSSFEVYSDKNIINEKINVKAQYCSLFKIRCVDIKYQVSVSIFSEEQIFCFSAMIIYY